MISCLKIAKEILTKMLGKTLVIDDYTCKSCSTLHVQNKTTCDIWVSNESNSIELFFRIQETDDLESMSIMLIRFYLYSEIDCMQSSPYYFPVEDVCMPDHFQEVFIYWLELLPHPKLFYKDILHKVCSLADYLYYKEIYASNCQLLEKTQDSKFHGLPKELRLRIYAMVLQDPRN